MTGICAAAPGFEGAIKRRSIQEIRNARFLMPTMRPGNFLAIAAAAAESMSFVFCFCGEMGPMPLPTMLRKAKTRVFGAVNDAIFEVGKILVAGAAGVRRQSLHNCGK